jgi:hypothetical protein
LDIEHCSNTNILFVFVFTTCSNRTSMCMFRFGPETPEHEPNRTPASLECCLLKFMTLLIDHRLREWAEAHSILPDSQNGFREGYQTHNNSFVLRTAIEKARAEGKVLYIAFIDLKNAFPSTHLPTLWSKLFSNGVSGPLFDWLRMLYAWMAYVMRDRTSLTKAFKSVNHTGKSEF